MELVQELVFTALIALLFSYFVAKLVSFFMAAGAADLGNSVDEKLKEVEDDVIMGELQFGQKMNVGILESHKNVDFVEETTETLHKFEQELNQIVEKESKTDDGLVEEEEEETSAELGISKNAEIEQSEEIDEVGKESKDGLLSDDDDWEGIERSESENIFAAAVKFVESGVKDDLLSDVKMDLYAFHKIATEGPCYQPQPMPLMLSDRSKWNAWQKLGNMNPEDAMDQYVGILSDRVPGWMKENYRVDDKLESEEIGKPGAVAHPDISSFKGNQTDFTHERNQELKSGTEGDLIGASSLETSANE